MSTLELSSLYSSGDIILENPIESSAIFLVVVVICASLEYLFTLAGDVGSKFFRVMFETISEEVLVVGSLSLLLTFGSSFFQSLPSSWAVMFQWTHICLLFMGVTFVVLLILTVATAFASNTKWKKFENSRMQGSPEGLSAREQKYRLAHEKFVLALRAFGLPTTVSFSQYLLKAEKRNLVALGNLSWKSWLALSTIVVLNALRTKINPQSPSATDPYDVLSTTDAIINVSSFIALAGYGTLAMFFYIHFSLQHRFRQYLMLNAGQGNNLDEMDEMRGAAGGGGGGGGGSSPGNAGGGDASQPLVNGRIDLDDPQSFLLWQNLNSTMSLIQACLMFFVWYSAVFFLNMVYTTFTFDIAFALLLIIAAMLPLIIFVVLVPWTLTTVAVLSTLGTNLRQEWVQSILAEADSDTRAVKDAKEDKPVEQSTVLKRSLRPVLLDDHALQRLSAANSQRRLIVPSSDFS